MARWSLYVRRKRAHDTKVRRMQAALQRNSFDDHLPRPFYVGRIDGVFGPRTAAACKRAKFWLGYSQPSASGGYLLLAFLEKRYKLPGALRERRVERLERYEQRQRGAYRPRIVHRKWSWRYPLLPRLGRVRYFVCHYSAGPASSTAEDIHGIHLGRGFAGIGYNAVIEADGTIVIGRPWHKRGAHTLHFNNHWAACLPGDNSAPPTEAQLEALRWLIRNRDRAAYHDLVVRGHREMPGNATDCPGRYWPWPGIR